MGLAWLRKYLEINATIEDAQKSISQIRSEKEAEAMLAKTIEKVREGFYNEGIRDGIQQGIKQGLQQGIQQGLQQGIHKKAIETAEALLKEGMSVKKTAAITGLAEKSVSKLKASL